MNPCGGTAWSTLANGQISVAGRGVLLPAPAFALDVVRTWQNFSAEFQAAAKKRAVPLSWLVAICSVETGLWSKDRATQASQSSSCCVGPMAIMVTIPNYKLGGYSSADEMWDPAKNIDTGAAIVAAWMKKGYDLPAIAAAYNAGSVCCPNSPTVAASPGGRQQNEFNLCSASPGGVSYPELAIQANNYAIAGGVGRSTSGWLLPLVLGGAVVAAAWFWGAQKLGSRSSSANPSESP